MKFDNLKLNSSENKNRKKLDAFSINQNAVKSFFGEIFIYFIFC